MHSLSTKKFTLLSCIALGGAVLAVAPKANADCPEPDPGALTAKSTPTAACTSADLTLLETEANKDNATFKDVETAVAAQSASCAACIFTKEGDATWGPVVYVGTDGSALANWGACFEKVAAIGAACGQAYNQTQQCMLARCKSGATYCTTEAEEDTCVDTVLQDTSSCGQYDMSTCPADNVLDQYCGDIVMMAKVICGTGGGGATDAGTSSSSGTSGTSGTSGSTSSSGGKTSSSSGSTSSSGSDDGDDTTSSTSSSGTSGGKKKGSSSGTSGTESEAAPSSTTTSGCAQGSSSGGSIAGALVVAAAVLGAASRRRRDSSR
jgi:hypothetical protein